MLSTIRHKLFSDSGFSLYAQACLLLANFLLFVVLLKGSEPDAYGHWALYITLVTIADSFRQGFLHHGFIRLFVQQSKEATSLTASALLINYGFIAIISLVLWGASLGQENTLLATLFANGWKGLLALGTLQFVNMLCIARQNFKAYFFQNLVYLVAFALGMGIFLIKGSPDFIAVINLQLVASIITLAFYLIQYPPTWALPQRQHLQNLWSFGRYAAGTNLLSMLFHKADVLMLAFFTSPATVALFHFATKLVAYADLPLNAFSQVIYPKLADAHRKGNPLHLKETYLVAILRLLALSIPLLFGMMIFNKHIINFLSTDDYTQSSTVIIILLIGSLAKPVGRVFGLLLDAMGKPQVNFQMLGFSLLVNVLMNALLIPAWGLTGAAIATSISIILTVAVGQWRLQKWVRIKHKDLLLLIGQTMPRLSFTKNSLS